MFKACLKLFCIFLEWLITIPVHHLKCKKFHTKEISSSDITEEKHLDNAAKLDVSNSEDAVHKLWKNNFLLLSFLRSGCCCCSCIVSCAADVWHRTKSDTMLGNQRKSECNCKVPHPTPLLSRESSEFTSTERNSFWVFPTQSNRAWLSIVLIHWTLKLPPLLLSVSFF